MKLFISIFGVIAIIIMIMGVYQMRLLPIGGAGYLFLALIAYGVVTWGERRDKLEA